MPNSMFVITLVTFLSLCSVAMAQTQVIERGNLDITRSLSTQEYLQKLLDMDSFMDEYTANTASGDMQLCSGWPAMAKVYSTHVEICSSSTKLGYEVRVLSRFKATSLDATPKCLASVRFELTISPGTTPQLLLDNVASVSTRYCLEGEGRKISYETTLREGKSKGMLFGVIVKEFKKLMPIMNASVSNLLK